jgi:hypothetical protein
VFSMGSERRLYNERLFAAQLTAQIEWVAFFWFLLCGGDCRRNCLVDWLSYWLDWFARLVECSLVVEVSLHPA